MQKRMKNKESMTGALSEQVYEAPRVEVLEVMVERGFSLSGESRAISDMESAGYDLDEN
jgi:hypothetical protein